MTSLTARDLAELEADLIRVRNRISNGWVKHTDAVDKNGEVVSFDDPHAVKYCLMGAVYRECEFGMQISPGEVIMDAWRKRRALEEIREAIDAVVGRGGEGHALAISSFNDSRSKRQVVALVNRAIKTVKKRAVEA